MSQEMTFSRPAPWAMWEAAMAPAAGPERTVLMARRSATRWLMMPPLD